MPGYQRWSPSPLLARSLRIFLLVSIKVNTGLHIAECKKSTKTSSNEQYDLRENKISETDLFESMKGMKNNKTPGNDGLTKEFYEAFWDEPKTPLMESVNQAFHTKILSISQRQAVIKLIEKRTGINVT